MGKQWLALLHLPQTFLSSVSFLLPTTTPTPHPLPQLCSPCCSLGPYLAVFPSLSSLWSLKSLHGPRRCGLPALGGMPDPSPAPALPLLCIHPSMHTLTTNHYGQVSDLAVESRNKFCTPPPMEGRTMPLPQFVLILTPRTYAWVLLLCKQGIGGCRWHEGWSPADLDGGGQTTLGSVLSACVQCTMGPSACKRAAGERTSGRRHNGAQPALQTREERPQAKGQGLQEL